MNITEVRNIKVLYYEYVFKTISHSINIQDEIEWSPKYIDPLTYVLIFMTADVQ